MDEKSIIDDIEDRHLSAFENVVDEAFAKARKLVAVRLREMSQSTVVASAWTKDD